MARLNLPIVQPSRFQVEVAEDYDGATTRQAGLNKPAWLHRVLGFLAGLAGFMLIAAVVFPSPSHTKSPSGFSLASFAPAGTHAVRGTNAEAALSGQTPVMPMRSPMGRSARIPTMPLRKKPTASRISSLRCSFEIEDVTEKAVEELDCMNWPGLEKRSADFTQHAGKDELLMVYVQTGSATITDSEESNRVTAGQILMVQDGDVQWTDVKDCTLISITTPVDDDDIDLSLAAAPAKVDPADDPVQDLSLKEAAILLAGGLFAGGLAVFGFKVFTSGGG